LASDIVPIELGLGKGDLVTLWAPRWVENGAEWEAFLGNAEDLYVFPDAAHLAAFVRTEADHDLADHPAWAVVPALAASELTPDDAHSYDLVGVPELLAEESDSWTVRELDDIVSLVRAIAEVCDLDGVQDVLAASHGFDQLPRGTLPFTGKDGRRLWQDLSEVVAQRWDEVLDAIDAITAVPEVDSSVLEAAEEELAAFQAELDSGDAEEDAGDADTVENPEGPEPQRAGGGAGPSEALEFWAGVGIDPIKIVTGGAAHYTLRCYLDDEPLFLGRDGWIDVFASGAELASGIARGAVSGPMTEVATWEEVTSRATGSGLVVEVDEDNSYILDGVGDEIEGGPEAIDAARLDLAVELLTDAAQWVGDEQAQHALEPSESLGWLVSYVLRPDPSRLAPMKPYSAEAQTWRGLVEELEGRLDRRGQSQASRPDLESGA
jgi:hypothetical protein